MASLKAIGRAGHADSKNFSGSPAIAVDPIESRVAAS